jgi:RNA polymerase sigma-70 factor (ECF subfamily)
MKIVAESAKQDDPDTGLLPAVARGDEAAFRTLYRRHTPRLRLLVLRILGGHEGDSEDVVQESWIRAMRSLAQFRGGSAFGTWLNGIGVRVAWETIRRRGPSPSLATPDERPAPVVDTVERIDLEAALRSLPDVQRTIVVLHDVEGFRHEEIAASLDIAVGTSRSHLSRAHRALRTLLYAYERTAP